ncbi:MAG: glutamate 5-kinase [Candidatus Goldiibacteriota bacterium HGW-Goldbacteria-1]|jgi:glutamate 5-kinase|nr:MAG: glutamate 5-kinase [Candidatus Goldiibacteriota bacterium HGW-Goldbacteria-1]
MYNRIVVKIGTNLIADEKGLRETFLKDFVRQVVELRKAGKEMIIVSSGAIGSGLIRMNMEKRQFTLQEKQAIAAIGQPVLMNRYKKLFTDNDVTVAQVLLNHDDVKDKSRNMNARNTLLKLIEWGVVPIINENDTVATEEIKFGDNDALAGIVGSLVNADLVAILTSVDGVYDKNPGRYSSAKKIEVIEDVEATIKEVQTDGVTSGGTGGMLSKLETARNLNHAGIPLIIANGNLKNVLIRSAGGENTGTLILRKGHRAESKKRWILLTLKAKGNIIIDDGAKKALLDSGKSLLAVGIAAVNGKFSLGDAVEIEDKAGTRIAKGVVNYSSEDVSLIKGRKKEEIKKIMKDNYYTEVIHRDNLFVYR